MEPQLTPNEVPETPVQEEKKSPRYRLWFRLIALVLVISILMSLTAVDFSLMRYQGTEQMMAAQYLMDTTPYIGQARVQRLKTLLSSIAPFEIYLNAAEIAIGKMDYARAANFLNKAIPDCQDTAQKAQLYNRLGCVYMLEEEPEKALEAFDSSILTDPKDPTPYVLRSQLRYQNADQEGATEDAMRYLQMGGQDPQMLTTALSILELGGELELAVEAATRIIAGAADDTQKAQGYGERGRIRYLLKLDQQAYEDISRAKNLDRTVLTGVHYAILGLQEYNRADYENSSKNFLQAARLSEDGNEEYYEQAIMCGYLSQNYDFIKTAIKEAKEKGQMTANSHLIDGIMTFSEENYKEAEAALTASLETGTTVAGAYYYRGLARLALGDYENAAQDFTLAVDWEEDVFSCIFNRGVCYYALEQDEKAITDLLYVAENASDESLVLSAVELLSGLQQIEDE